MTVKIIRFFRKRFVAIMILGLAGLTVLFIRRQYFTVKQDYKSETHVKVKSGSLKEELTISGEIDAEEKITLRFQTSGRLNWIGVKEGDYVRKYQAIASLDKRDVEKNLKKKLLAYMNERWDFEQTHDDYSVRGRQLYQVPGLTDEERRILDKAQFDLESTVLDVEIQNLAVEYANLWTPIAGIVTRIGSPYAGTNITPAQAEFEIINPDSVFFSALADETEVIKIMEGTTGELVLDAYPDNLFNGKVKKVSFIPKTGESGTVYTVKFQFNDNNTDYRFRMGMVGDVTFETGSRKNVLVLPNKYIKTENGEKHVFVKRGDKIEKNKITTGLETDSDSEIKSGVKKGDLVYLPD
ncbi:hypothetical protein A3I80_02065 [Candidatus Gottesmanbacteria bacterium RIFCSPLOWO2_02_FULL_40_10]|nr:MAG: hypothetical protein A3I80_02065 [Candidatus Gottesmanbacteria bacterium RIFCSPLOWO2_02_FULL_40_10]